MKEILATILEEAFVIIERSRKGMKRQIEFPKAENMIKVAIGMRRSGKTYFLYQTINKLLDEGISREQILFINFEDDRLLPMDAKGMGELIDAFYSLYPENHNRRCYLFLDEVQNVEDWHLVVRRYFDSKNVQLYLTGSSAKLLSKEINTSLRGRSLALEVYPYSFQEYLVVHKLPSQTGPFGQASFDKMQKQLLNYCATGGFPAVQSMLKNEWRNTLQGYIDTVILKDIIERHSITNISLLKYLTITLLKNMASVFTVNKFFNDIKSQGYQVSKDTIHNYLKYIQDAFLVFCVSHYSESERIKQTKPKKIYAIDSGLVNAAAISFSDNYGRALENLVYLDLRRQNKKVYYYNTAEGNEVDFVAIDQEGKRELIQVCWDMSDAETVAREQRALEQAEKELRIKGKIITAREYLEGV